MSILYDGLYIFIHFILSTGMATSNRCSVCRQEIGVLICPGCNAYFCMKDLRGHREKLSTELDRVIEERAGLQEKINRTTQHSVSSSPLIVQIDQWQNDMIRSVKQVAEQARRHVFELSDSKRVKLGTEFMTFSQELAHLKETQNFVEHDLTRLKQRVRELGQDLGQLSQTANIELYTVQSDRIEWNRLLYIEDKSNNRENQQWQRQTTGEHSSNWRGEHK
jgi:hypothetical protein